MLGMGGPGDDIDWNQLMTVIIIVIVIFVFFSWILGGTLLDMWSQRVKRFHDIENLAHLHVYRALQRSCRLSVGTWVRNLYQKSLDPQVMGNAPFGMIRRGTVKGSCVWRSAVYIWYRPRRFSRSYIVTCPVEMLLSSIDDVNIIIEGTAVKNYNLDYVLPIPSKKNKKWTEEKVRDWARLNYKYLMTEHSDFTLRDFEEHQKIKAGSDPASLRMIQQGIGNLTVASETEYLGEIE